MLWNWQPCWKRERDQFQSITGVAYSDASWGKFWGKNGELILHRHSEPPCMLWKTLDHVWTIVMSCWAPNDPLIQRCPVNHIHEGHLEGLSRKAKEGAMAFVTFRLPSWTCPDMVLQVTDIAQMKHESGRQMDVIHYFSCLRVTVGLWTWHPRVVILTMSLAPWTPPVPLDILEYLKTHTSQKEASKVAKAKL